MVNDMSNYLKHIFRKALYLWPCLCVVLAASCMEEEQCDTCSKYPVKVQLNITAEEEHSLNTRATVVGQNHEYINTLCVLLVKGGKVVKKLLPDLSANDAAKTGNLKNYTSELFELESGFYTVYAFANMSETYLSEWPKISGLTEGADVSSVDFSNMVLTNPAGKLDFTTYFIPMSAKQVVTVDASTRSISIGLDRLVSKIRINVTPTDVKVNSLTFGGCANGVKLFADGGTASSIAYDVKKTMNFTDPQSTVADFYVNATEESGHPFSVELTTNEHSGTTYEAVTSRSELPRNSIFPLTLQLNQYGLKLEAQCWVSPIGHVPVPVKVSLDPDTYEVKVPEGCQFAFTVNVVQTSDGAVVAAPSSKWTIQSSTIPGIAFDGATENVQTVRGHISATVGQTYDLGAEVSWTAGGKTYRRIYTVRLKVGDINDFEFASSSRLLRPEFLSLMQTYK
jgi:hypothetical protein